MKKHIKQRLGTSFFSKKASQEKAKQSLEDRVPESIFCKHGLYCYKLKQMDKAHCSLDYAKTCGQVKKHYDKYGEKGNHLGVGS